MKIIDNIALNITKNVRTVDLEGSELNREDIYEIYKYKLNQYVIDILMIMTILVISYILNTIIGTAIYLLTYSSLRRKFGGYHLKSKTLCFIVTVIVTVIAGMLAKFISYDISYISIVVGLVTILKVGVSDNINYVIKESNKKILFKKGLMVLSMIIICMMLLKLNDSNIYVNGMSLGIIVFSFNSVIKKYCNDI